jgi:hypothetical protein
LRQRVGSPADRPGLRPPAFAHRQRRKLARQPLDDELEEALGTVEVRQGGVAEVAEAEALRQLVPHEIGGSAREEHLAAVTGVSDSRGLVHREADVAVAAEARLAGVDAHPHPHRDSLRPVVTGERKLPSARCGGGRSRAAEDGEERVPLGLDLDAAGLCEGSAHEPVVRAQNFAVAVTPEALQELCRAFDIAEQERHRPCGQRSRRLRDRGNAQCLFPRSNNRSGESVERVPEKP